jgi:hypothetical protein
MVLVRLWGDINAAPRRKPAKKRVVLFPERRAPARQVLRKSPVRADLVLGAPFFAMRHGGGVKLRPCSHSTRLPKFILQKQTKRTKAQGDGAFQAGTFPAMPPQRQIVLSSLPSVNPISVFGLNRPRRLAVEIGDGFL